MKLLKYASLLITPKRTGRVAAAKDTESISALHWSSHGLLEKRDGW